MPLRWPVTRSPGTAQMTSWSVCAEATGGVFSTFPTVRCWGSVLYSINFSVNWGYLVLLVASPRVLGWPPRQEPAPWMSLSVWGGGEGNHSQLEAQGFDSSSHPKCVSCVKGSGTLPLAPEAQWASENNFHFKMTQLHFFLLQKQLHEKPFVYHVLGLFTVNCDS